MLTIGLIGCGHIAKKHLKTLTRFSEIELIAVSDVQQIRMEEAIEKYQQEKGGNSTITLYENYNDMLLDQKVDAVIVSLISGLHAEVVKKALEHGKHIIVEKPISLSIQDAEDIVYLSCKYKKKVLVCHQLRYRPMFQKVKKLLEEGCFGDPYLAVASIRLNRTSDYYSSTNWRGTWEKDGGMLVNQGIHLVDLLVWLMGDIKSVYGEIAKRINNKDTEDLAMGIISFENKAKGLIEANTITKPHNLGYYLSIFGENGSVCIGGQEFNVVEHCYVENYPNLDDELQKLSNELDEHYLMYQDFIESIAMDEQILMTPEEGKRALEAIFAIYQSDKTGRPVIFPMENFSINNMLD